jgi:hypothetical protein
VAKARTGREAQVQARTTAGGGRAGRARAWREGLRDGAGLVRRKAGAGQGVLRRAAHLRPARADELLQPLGPALGDVGPEAARHALRIGLEATRDTSKATTPSRLTPATPSRLAPPRPPLQPWHLLGRDSPLVPPGTFETACEETPEHRTLPHTSRPCPPPPPPPPICLA